MLDIPTNAKEFDRWFLNLPLNMPDDLEAKGRQARLALLTKNQRAWKQSYALRKLGLADWNAFANDPRLPEFVAR